MSCGSSTATSTRSPAASTWRCPACRTARASTTSPTGTPGARRCTRRRSRRRSRAPLPQQSVAAPPPPPPPPSSWPRSKTSARARAPASSCPRPAAPTAPGVAQTRRRAGRARRRRRPALRRGRLLTWVAGHGAGGGDSRPCRAPRRGRRPGRSPRRSRAGRPATGPWTGRQRDHALADEARADASPPTRRRGSSATHVEPRNSTPASSSMPPTSVRARSPNSSSGVRLRRKERSGITEVGGRPPGAVPAWIASS